jgi:hypothetical protein
MSVSSATALEQIGQLGSVLLDSLQQWCSARQMYADGWVKETRWSNELGEVLNAQGMRTVHQGPYPGSRKSCDLISHLGDGSEFWLEIKGAWLITRPFVHSDGRRIGGKRNTSYRKHLFHEDESALKDVAVKLSSIAGPNKYVGFLLIGFDSVHLPMDKEIDELLSKGQLNSGAWTAMYRDWPNQLDKDYRIRCWFWYRSA